MDEEAFQRLLSIPSLNRIIGWKYHVKELNSTISHPFTYLVLTITFMSNSWWRPAGSWRAGAPIVGEEDRRRLDHFERTLSFCHYKYGI